jgi:hypothetical protein
VRNSTSGRGSLSELGLMSLQGMARTGIPESTPELVLTTPLRLGHENGFMGADPSPLRPNEDHTPRSLNRSAVYSHGDGPDDTQMSGQRRSGLSRSVSHTQAETQGSSHDQPWLSRSQRGDRRRIRFSSSPTSTSRAGDDQVEGRDPPALDPGNALALTFNSTLTPVDYSHSSHSHSSRGSTSRSHLPQITAPTPIVSTQNVMRAWALDVS